MPIRAGKMRRIAPFGAYDTYTPARYVWLDAICFTAGAMTDRGVGIGSRLGALRRAYGNRLQARRYPGDPDFRVVANTLPPRIAIGFVLRPQRVTKLALAMDSNQDLCT
jgi:hypothetical protein